MTKHPLTEPYVYQAIVLKAGLKMYHKSKIQPNRSWTPMNMLKMAGKICFDNPDHYKRGQYQQAIDDLTLWLAGQHQTRSY